MCPIWSKIDPFLFSKLAHLLITHSNWNPDAYKKFGIDFTKYFSLLILNSINCTCICNQTQNTIKFKGMKLIVHTKLTLKRPFLPNFGSILGIFFARLSHLSLARLVSQIWVSSRARRDETVPYYLYDILTIWEFWNIPKVLNKHFKWNCWTKQNYFLCFLHSKAVSQVQNLL